jgi:hypothetical protein
MPLPSRLRTSLYAVAHVPPVLRVAERLPFVRRIHGGRGHSFDAANGTDTSGFIAVARRIVVTKPLWYSGMLSCEIDPAG